MEVPATGIPRINIRKVVYDKNPAIARILPGFVYRYIQRIIHEEEINEFLRKHGHKMDLEFVRAVLDDFNVTVIIKGEENLPQGGRYIFAGNHPLGGFDGMVMMDYLGRKFGVVKFISNDILLNIKNLTNMFIPINKHGGHSKEVVKVLDDAMSSQIQIATFPAGLVSRRIKGKIRDLEWKKNFISKAVQHHRDIIPFHVSGRNTGWFYFLANFRKLLGIKWNLEMFYLPDETFKHKNKTITITFGKPISWQYFDKSKTPAQWAAWTKELVYALGEYS